MIENNVSRRENQMSRAILTIDDIASRNTPAIVDYLQEKSIKAIMFATGENVERYYPEAMYAVKNGMIVGNHSYSHPAFSSIPLEAGIEDIEKCEGVLNKLYRDCGIERTFRPFRFPYGNKGGEHKDALQQYLRDKQFNKVDDTLVSYPWWKKEGMNTDVDTFWTFDFEEYRLYQDPDFTKEHIWTKMHDPNPHSGAALFGENNWHMILLHAHDETEAILPEYYKLFIEHLLKNGLTFDEPAFFK